MKHLCSGKKFVLSSEHRLVNLESSKACNQEAFIAFFALKCGQIFSLQGVFLLRLLNHFAIFLKVFSLFVNNLWITFVPYITLVIFPIFSGSVFGRLPVADAVDQRGFLSSYLVSTPTVLLLYL